MTLRRFFTHLAVLSFLMLCLPLLGKPNDMIIPKKNPNYKDNYAPVKQHPFYHKLSEGKVEQPTLRAENFDKLLVLLIDFQEDDDPKTTGNGKFLLNHDPDYPLSIGAPPHDYDYFMANLSAMRYYYLAASLGNYDLKYDVYPKRDKRSAYTLPQKMSYYNPGFNDYNLFISRVEEYFRDIFTVADSYGEIDFSQYAHFMVIHAGSDWQHDVAGDTPYDLPSFFIRVGDGKEAWVNNGTVKISHACNVPSTISQDGRYGALNAVMAHEFGHSIGFVDLYNVNNHSPAVGYWDIMDSGGAAQIQVEGLDGKYYLLEGGLPSLPSAWHRTLVWGAEFKQMGVYKEIEELDQKQKIELSAATRFYDRRKPLPYVVKVTLTNTEYILLENRNTDPDGDGGIAFKGALPITEGGTDYRVLHYPTGIDDPNSKPTYEYDWLLPGWMKRDGTSIGGGIVVWHVDENIIYNEGIWTDSGEFISNYEANRVNATHSKRGIKIIEADNINDIGNVDSWFWYGTEYEPYFRYRPELDQDGYFVRWSPIEFNSSLSSISKPPLKTNAGYRSLYSIYDIGSPSGVMSFKYKFQPYANSTIIATNETTFSQLPASKSTYFDGVAILPLITDQGLSFYRHLYDSVGKKYYWEDVFGPISFGYEVKQQALIVKTNTESSDYIIVSGSRIIIVEDSGGMPNIKNCVVLEDDILETPLQVSYNGFDWLIIPTESEVIVYSLQEREIKNAIPIANAQICSDEGTLYLINDEKVYSVSLEDILGVQASLSLAITSFASFNKASKAYYPIAYSDKNKPDYRAMFLQDGNGNVWKYRDSKVEQIFTLAPFTNEKPTQLAFTTIDNKSYLIFAAGERLFLIDIFGNMASGYPITLDKHAFSSQDEICIVQTDKETLFILPIKDKGYLFYEYGVGVRHDLSMIWDKTKLKDDFYWEEGTSLLHHFFLDKKGNLYDNVVGEYDSDPVVWKGYRNNNTSSYIGAHQIQLSSDGKLIVYAYPNPVKSGEARIRIEGGKDKITVSLYDISGKKLTENTYTQGVSDKYDVLWNVSKLPAGVYFGTVKSNGRTTTFKIAVEK